MKDRSQFGADPRGTTHGLINCASVEPLLAEAAEGILPEEATQRLASHLAQCPACRELVQHSSRGREWLLVLKREVLEPPADLVAKILARTSGETMAGTMGMPAFHPGDANHAAAMANTVSVAGSRAARASAPPPWQRTPIAMVRRTLIEPRLALVAAMAFFSITLTMNLLGVRLTDVRPSDFTPQHLRRAVTRQYAQANARVVRYYENLRIVYEVESQVQELRRAAETAAPSPAGSRAPSGDKKPRKGSSKFGGNQSRADGHHLAISPAKEGKRFVVPADPEPIKIGPLIEAALHMTGELQSFNGHWPRAAQEIAPLAALRLSISKHFVPPERGLA